MSEKIDMWCQRGVVRDEIISRMRERDRKDCVTAWSWIGKMFPSETMLQICKMSDCLRSTRKVMDCLIPKFCKSLSAGAPVEEIIELFALTVEHYVRTADECFPKASNN